MFLYQNLQLGPFVSGNFKKYFNWKIIWFSSTEVLTYYPFEIIVEMKERLLAGLIWLIDPLFVSCC